MAELGYQRVARRLLVGLDLLTAALVILAISQPSRGAWVWPAALAFAAAQVFVRWAAPSLDQPPQTRAVFWPAGAAVLVQLVCFAGLLATSRTAIWLAFPLMLLHLHVLGPLVGMAAAGAITMMTIADAVLVRGDLSPGPVLGPLIGALVSVAVVSGLESLTRLVWEKQQALDELGLAQARLAEAERRRAVIEERELLGRDLHDTLTQDFAAIDLQLRSALASLPGDSPARPPIEAARGAAIDGLGEARRLVRALAESDIGARAFTDALARIADRASSGGLTTRLRVEGTPQPIATEVSTALLRIAQSALGNVVQHADATSVELTLTWEPGLVVMDIVDDGRGFDLAAVPTGEGGFGLPAMRARVVKLGGRLSVESAPAEGTALAVVMPLAETGARGEPATESARIQA